MQVRLQKVLAHAGVTSRRKAEEMIQQGRVTVNGHVITALGSKADPVPAETPPESAAPGEEPGK